MLSNKSSSSKTNSNGFIKYVVISPVKDEAEYLDDTINSMIQQTIRPVMWVIVNDGSKDGTEAIINNYARKYSWIKQVNRKDAGIRQRGKGVVEAFYAGFEVLDEDYDFIVKLDGDVTFEKDYFASLFRQFALDPQLGIAGGGLYERPDGKFWVLYTVKDHVRGCTKVYRRECFEAIGGLVASMGWDGIDEWIALAKGWKVVSFLTLKIYHYRFTGAATGYLKSCIEQGNGAYRMGYHPLFMIARGIRRITDKPFFIGGMAMIGGYFMAWLKKQEFLADPTVVRYVRQSQMKQLAGLISGKPLHGD